METTPEAQVFVSYSHKDREWLKQFLTMLQPYVQKNGISVWSDKHITAGARWRDAITEALRTARVAVLLVSPDFLASEFVQEEELPVLLSAERKGRVTIQWIAVRPSLYAETPIEEFQALNDPSRPLATLEPSKVEGELVTICYRLIEALLAEPNSPDDRALSRRERRELRPDPRMIHEKLLELERARRERDAFLAKQFDENLQLVNNKSLPIEIVLGGVVLSFPERLEAQLKYDVTLLATIEAIRDAGLDPRVYDLPSFDEALQQFRLRRGQYNQSGAAKDELLASIENMIAAPIRNIR